jgi:protocatechuate 3,4-dioxygenase beta subunit
MKILIVLALAAMTGQAGQPAQTATPQGPPGSVEGIAIRFGSSDPIAKAAVELRRTQVIAAGPGTLVLPPGAQLPPGFQLPPGVQIVTPPPPLLTTTNADGRFQFSNVPPGEYRVYATRETGYMPAEYGQRSPTGEGIPLVVAAGQRYSDLRLALAPTGSISGRIIDGSGSPVEYVRIRLLREAYRDGAHAWVIAQTALTDDHGEYRLYSLPPGKYYIGADLWDNRSTRVGVDTEPTVYPNRFAGQSTAGGPLVIKRVLENGDFVEEIAGQVLYPGTKEIAAAKSVPLHIGESIQGINFSVAAATEPGRHVRGVVSDGVTGTPAAGALVRLVPRVMQGPTLTIPAATADANGVFDVPGVSLVAHSLIVTTSDAGFRPGPLVATGPAPTGPLPGNEQIPKNAYTVIEAGNGDVNDIQLTAVPAVNIPWRASFDDDVDDAALRNLRITLVRDPDIIGQPRGNTVVTAGWTGLPEGVLQPPTQPNPSGGFLLWNVPFGEYRTSVAGLPQGAYLKSIRQGGTDVLRDGLRVLGAVENPIEIVLSKMGGRLEGRVLNRDKQPEKNVPVVLVPANRSRKDLFQKTSSDANGRFKFDGILPDQYKVFAWEDVVAGAWQDPDFLRAFEPRGVTVNILIGTPVMTEVELIPWSDSQ